MTDDELKRRLPDVEDTWTERKSQAHSDEIKQTLVAFANSIPKGQEAISFVGVTNEGEVLGVSNPEKSQDSIKKAGEGCYPIIRPGFRILNVDGKSILAVIVGESADRPHFSGPAFVRRGHRSENANETEFAELIARRSSRAWSILEAKGNSERVLVRMWFTEHGFGSAPVECEVLHCDTTRVAFREMPGSEILSADLEDIKVSFGPGGKQLSIKIMA